MPFQIMSVVAASHLFRLLFSPYLALYIFFMFVYFFLFGLFCFVVL